ncbi:MAG: NAD-dependent epimerase/dehydratase family protein, partial [Spirochaetales bacterium]
MNAEAGISEARQNQKGGFMGTCVITGASGHLGANLARLLLEQGRRVRALVREDVRALEGLDIECKKGDVMDRGSLEACFGRGDTVFNCAGRISLTGQPDPFFMSTNMEGVRNVVDVCLAKGVSRLVHVSSIHAFAEIPGNGTLDETMPLVTKNGAVGYDVSKAEGQRIVQDGAAKGLDAVIVNPAAIIGPFDYKPSSMGELFIDLCNNRMPILIDAGFNWVDARDAASGLIAAESRGRTGECYLLAGEWKKLRDLASAISDVTGRQTARSTVPVPLALMASRVNWFFCRLTGTPTKFTPFSIETIQMHRYVSHRKAAEELGYKPRPFAQTVKDTIAWFEQAGRLKLSG